MWEECADNVGFVYLIGDKDKVDAAFAGAAHVVKHSFVINRVTAASMEPRNAVGHYDIGEDRYTVYTALQRPQPTRAELAKLMKVPESQVRVVTGDTGGSFGMKSPIFNEVPLVLLASKLTGRPVKWISTRTEAFLSDAQARDHVTEAELALDKDGHFLAMRAKAFVAIGAYLQNAMPAFIQNAGTLAGVYRTPAIHVDYSGVFTNTNPMRPYRGNGRPEVAFVIERMVDIAADELGIDPIELRRRNYVPASAMPFKTGLTFTYDSGEFEKNMDMALEIADAKGFAKRKAEAAKRGKLLGFGLSNTIERAGAASLEGAEVRFSRSGTLTLFSGSNSQGQGHETVFKQLVCDRLGIDPHEAHYIQGDTDEIFFGEGTGGSRSMTLAGSAFHNATEKVVEKARAIAAHMLQVSEDDLKFEEGVFSTSQDQPHAQRQGNRHRGHQSEQPAGRHGAGPDGDRGLSSAGRQLPERLPHLRGGDRPRHRRDPDRALQRGRRRRHRDEPDAAARPDPRRHRARRRPGADGGHPFRRCRPARHGVVPWTTPCRTRTISAP